VRASLRENIAGGRQLPSQERLRRVLADSGLDALIERQGLDCTLDDKLRAADRCRIEVARALLADARLLLVEDFTGGIDTACAIQLLRALNTHAESIVAVGSRDLLLELATAVIWVERDGGVRAECSVGEFLGSREGIRLFPPRRAYGAVKWAA
jgi:ABC-type transport system involved in cytochrome bd biosynthesis fused ATPase/permease subunit